MRAPRFRSLSFVVAVAALSSMLIASPVGAQFPGTPGRIAFLASLDGQPRADIYSIMPDGTGLRRLTSSPNAGKSGPVWSPDGTMITFHVVTLNGPVVTVMRRDGSGRRQVASGSNPTWTSDGDLLFESTTKCPRGRILATSTLNGSVTPLSICGLQPAMSPDGSKIAYTRPRDPVGGGGFANRDVYIVSPNGSNRDRIARSRGTEAEPAGLFSPAWSPDGAFVAFEDIRSQEGCTAPISRIRKVRISTGDASKGPVEELGFDWSPAGDRFVAATVTRDDPCVFDPTSSSIVITTVPGATVSTVIVVPFDEDTANLVADPSWQPK